MNGIVSIAAIVAMLLAAGAAIGRADHARFRPAWLLVAAGLVLLNDALLTNFYGLLPDVLGGNWNWQGKVLALAATLGIAALPAMGWKGAGITLRQHAGFLRAVMPVAILYIAFIAAIAFAFPSESADRETIFFQLTLPGLEEELFYRGLLLLALDRAFLGRRRFAGVDWGWGALLSTLLFGLAHAFGYADGAFGFDAATMAFTAIPSLLAVWFRLRTGSLLLPILLHNAGNSLSLLV